MAWKGRLGVNAKAYLPQLVWHDRSVTAAPAAMNLAICPWTPCSVCNPKFRVPSLLHSATFIPRTFAISLAQKCTGFLCGYQGTTATNSVDQHFSCQPLLPPAPHATSPPARFPNRYPVFGPLRIVYRGPTKPCFGIFHYYSSSDTCTNAPSNRHANLST